MNELRFIHGYGDQYLISDTGIVFGKRRGGGYSEKNQRLDRYGYKRITLYKESIGKTVLIHTLVLNAFIGAKPVNKQACHNDGDKMNNSVSNLRWDSCKNNQLDKKKHGTQAFGEKVTSAKLTNRKVKAMRNLEGLLTQKEMAEQFGVSLITVNRVIRRVTWRHV